MGTLRTIEYWRVFQAGQILRQKFLQDRVMLVEKFIDLTRCMLDLRNFNGACEVMTGLQHQSVASLKLTWRVCDGTAMCSL